MRNRLSQYPDHLHTKSGHVIGWLFYHLLEFTERKNISLKSMAMFKYGLLRSNQHAFESLVSDDEFAASIKVPFDAAKLSDSERFYYFLGVYFFVMYSMLILPMCVKGELDWLRSLVVKNHEIHQMSLLEHYLELAHLLLRKRLNLVSIYVSIWMSGRLIF